MSIRPNPAKHWFFTFNNYKREDLVPIEAIFKEKCARYIFQEETGESGTEHLQGYIELKFKNRPLTIFPDFPKIHWEKCKDRTKAKTRAIEYCCKPETRTGDIYTYNIEIPEELRVITNLYPWQQQIVDSLKLQPDDATIRWYWEPVGGIGKTALYKYICVHHNALICSGRAVDMKHMIAQFIENKGCPPKIVIFNVPRAAENKIDYIGMEEIKDGIFASTKYETSMVVMNSPHVLVFANFPPEKRMLSARRWDIWRLDEKNEGLDTIEDSE